ncbi:MAG: hypothetical protein D6739_02650 [Nitrospirae bacterium]|nr:MAG: hypothetical protein D6739_02650 [Nitrospirota bacterium]
MDRTLPLLLAGLLLAAPAAAPAATPATADGGLLSLERQWDHIAYELPKAERAAAFDRLAADFHRLAEARPQAAAPRVWEAITLASEAGAKGGLGALSLVKRARKLLLEALRLEPNPKDDAVFTTLGSLYDQVPGWPIGFGDAHKAEAYLKRALALNPQGIDANFFYGQYLHHHHRDREAATYLKRCLTAPPRPGREVGDAGRREQARQLLATLR